MSIHNHYRLDSKGKVTGISEYEERGGGAASLNHTHGHACSLDADKG